MEESQNIYQKLAKIRERVKVLKKDKRGYNYSYLSDETIMASISGLMNDLHISLIPHIVPGSTVVTPVTYTKRKVLKDGTIFDEIINETMVRQDLEYHWVNNDNPEDRIVVPWFSVGQQQDPSQAFGSGLTYASRYFKLQYFGISTTENDPDNWRSKQKQAEEEERKEVCGKLIAQIDSVVNTYLATHPEKRDQIVATIMANFSEKGKPSANYNAIKDPVIAANLLTELQKFTGQGDQAVVVPA